MANEVFWFDSTDVGAPTLNNAAGTVISVLDACLVNGFNSKTITIDVTSNVATATCTSHGFVAQPGKYILVAGATPSGLNGLKLITSVPNANTFTYAAPGVADGAATGTITAKRAGIGWTKSFTGTNKAVYKSSDPASTGLFLRIDDTNSSPATATDARAVMYESMSDVDTGTAPSPTAAQLSGGQFWNKGVNNSTAKTWVLIGDGLAFYLYTQQASNTAQYHCHFFGDVVSYRAADAYGCAMAGSSTAFSGGASGGGEITFMYDLASSPADYGYVISRIASATGACVRTRNVGAGRVGQVIGGSNNPAFPSPVDNGLLFARPVYLAEENSAFTHPIRGEMPGMLAPLASQPFTNLQVVSGLTGMTGSLLIVTGVSGSAIGRQAFDISNAWRV